MALTQQLIYLELWNNFLAIKHITIHVKSGDQVACQQ